MICGAEGLSELFSVFHDGGIKGHSQSGKDLSIVVEIPYLAERVNPAYQSFKVTIHEIRELGFSTWPKNPGIEPSILNSLVEIFEPELGILSSQAVGETIRVVCDRSSAEANHSGGELSFIARGATVSDEGGKEYSIDELCRIASDYWAEWSKGDA